MRNRIFLLLFTVQFRVENLATLKLMFFSIKYIITDVFCLILTYRHLTNSYPLKSHNLNLKILKIFFS